MRSSPNVSKVSKSHHLVAMRGTAAGSGFSTELGVCYRGENGFKHRTKPTKIYFKNFDLKNMNQRDMWMCFHANTWRCAAINAQEHYTKRNPHSPILKKIFSAAEQNKRCMSSVVHHRNPFSMSNRKQTNFFTMHFTLIFYCVTNSIHKEWKNTACVISVIHTISIFINTDK